LLLLSWLVLVLDLEERLAILDANLRDDRNRSEEVDDGATVGGEVLE
jgi:hypothetical protein